MIMIQQIQQISTSLDILPILSVRVLVNVLFLLSHTAKPVPETLCAEIVQQASSKN